jgi:hypothetical protein
MAEAMARTEPHYLRNPRAIVVGAGPSSIVVAPGGPPALLPRLSGEKLSAILRAALAPVTAAALRRLADARTLALLVEQRALLEGAPDALVAARGRAPRDAIAAKACKRLVLGVTGAINAVHSYAIAAHLAHFVAERVDVVLTPAACKLVRPRSFRYLGLDVWTDAFATRGDVTVPHMHLAAADLIAILPATAATIHKLATGACTDLLSLACAATRAPIVVGPSMNGAMWDDVAIAANVRTLRARGVYVIEPTIGTEVSAKEHGGWELGPSPIDPVAIAETIRAVLAARAAAATPRPRPTRAPRAPR